MHINPIKKQHSAIIKCIHIKILNAFRTFPQTKIKSISKASLDVRAAYYAFARKIFAPYKSKQNV